MSGVSETSGSMSRDYMGGFVEHMANVYGMKIAGGMVEVYGETDEVKGIGGSTGTMVGGSLRKMFGGWDIDSMCAEPDCDDSQFTGGASGDINTESDAALDTESGGCSMWAEHDELAQGCGNVRGVEGAVCADIMGGVDHGESEIAGTDYDFDADIPVDNVGDHARGSASALMSDFVPDESIYDDLMPADLTSDLTSHPTFDSPDQTSLTYEDFTK